MTNHKLQIVLAGLAIFYFYFFSAVMFLTEPVFPIFYNLFFGTYTPGPKCIEDDYLAEGLTLIFLVFLPVSLLLSTFTIRFLKKQASRLQNKLFFFLSIIGVGATSYFAIKLFA